MKKLLFVGILLLAGCTANDAARNYGGTETINLEPNRKLINVTWKGDSNLWILTRKMDSEEKAESYEFKEKSSYGILEGTVVIKESK